MEMGVASKAGTKKNFGKLIFPLEINLPCLLMYPVWALCGSPPPPSTTYWCMGLGVCSNRNVLN